MRRTSYILFICLISAVNSIYGASYTWVGTTTSWTTAANWSPAVVPGSNDQVTINGSASAYPVLSTSVTLKRLTLSGGSLNLNDSILQIDSLGTFSGGSISGGANSGGILKLRGSAATFSGSTINCIVDAVCNQVKFNGSHFTKYVYGEQNGTATSSGQGGNVFDDSVTIKNTSTQAFILGIAAPDTFNAKLTAINTGSLPIRFSDGAACVYQDNIVLSSTSGGIAFSLNGGGGTSTIGSNKTITIGTAGFSSGNLTLRNITQLGSGFQTIAVTGTSAFNITSCIFYGYLDFSAPTVVSKLSDYYGPSTFTKTNNSTSQWDGGNIFHNAVTFNNNTTSTAAIRLAATTGDTYLSSATYNTTTGFIQPNYRDTTNYYAGISINSNKVVFNSNTGVVAMKGSGARTIGGTSSYAIGKILIDLSTGGTFSLYQSTTIDSLVILRNGVMAAFSTFPLTLKASCSISRTGNTSFISGPCKKIGNQAFTFPIGYGSKYMPLTISAPSNITDAFTAEYIHHGSSYGFTSDTSLMLIDYCEYWELSRNTGSSTVKVTLAKESNSCTSGNASDYRVCYNSGSLWTNIGNSAYTDSSVTSASNASVFGVFTLAVNRKGNGCTNAIPLTASSVPSDTLVNITDSLVWFKFTADSTRKLISYKSYNPDIDTITYTVYIYSGTCGSLILKDSFIVENSQTSSQFFVNNLTIGVNYYIVLSSAICSTCAQLSNARFYLNVSMPIAAIPIPLPNPIVYFTFDNPVFNLLPLAPTPYASGSILYSYVTQISPPLNMDLVKNSTSWTTPTKVTSTDPTGNYANFPKTSGNQCSALKSATSQVLGSSPESFSVEFRVRFSETVKSNRQAHLFTLGNFNADLKFNLFGNVPTFTFANPQVNLEIPLDGMGKKSINHYFDDNWHYLVFIVRTNSSGFIELEMWVDGELNDDFRFVSNITGPVSSSQLFDIKFAGGTTNTITDTYDSFFGDLDELAVYDRALSSNEIFQHKLDLLSIGHYSVNSASIVPAPISLNSILDVKEFPKGYVLGTNNYSSPVAYADVQLRSYPAPRYNPSVTVPRNVNWVKSTFMSDINSWTGLPPAKITRAVAIQNELAKNWNFYYNFTEDAYKARNSNSSSNVTTDVSAAFINDINSNSYPLAGLLFRHGIDVTTAPSSRFFNCTGNINGAANRRCAINCQTLEGTPTGSCLLAPNSLYPRDGSGNILLNSISGAGALSWSPKDDDRPVYLEDGIAMVDALDLYINPHSGKLNLSNPSRIEMLVENNEYAILYDEGELEKDASVNSEYLASGLPNMSSFQAQQKSLIDNEYRDYILSSPILSLGSAQYLNYAVDGFFEPPFGANPIKHTRHRYEFNRETQLNGPIHYSTPDIYPLEPKFWATINGAHHGFRWLSNCRNHELIDDGFGHQFEDYLTAPFVSAGYNDDPELDMRPGQYLGFLKSVLLQGVDFFQPGFFPDGTNPQLGSSFCWQVATPSYVQAIGSRIRHIILYGKSLPGEPYDQNYRYNIGPGGTPGASYKLKTINPSFLVTARQDYDDDRTTPRNRYAISASIMPFSNRVGAAPLLSDVTVTIGSQQLKMPIRRQGSTFVYDFTNTSNVVFYQLDKWHQYEHPEYWSKDFDIEAELFDNSTASALPWEIRSENIIPGTVIDVTDVTSYLHFTSLPTSPVSYYFQPRADGVANDYTISIRARSSSTNKHIDIDLLDGTTSQGTHQITVSNPNWEWYTVPMGVTYPGLLDGVNYQLQLLPNSTDIEIDEIKVNSPEFYDCSGTIIANNYSNGLQSSQLPANTVSSQTIYIQGTFIVNQNFTFNNCTVYCAAGAQIIVQPGVTLTLDHTNFSACSQMWRGIVVQRSGHLVSDNLTLISDAEFAITALNRSSIIVTNTTFKRNYCGIYVPSSGTDATNIFGNVTSSKFEGDISVNLADPYDGQTHVCPDPNYSYAGIILENGGLSLSNSSSSSPNTFSYLNIGIINTSTGLTIANCRFSHIKRSVASNDNFEGSAIYSHGSRGFSSVNVLGFGSSTSPSMISDCDFGVFAVLSGLKVQDCRFESIKNTGIVGSYAIRSNIKINNNYIESDHIGIQLTMNDGANMITVDHNDIEIALSGIENDNIGISHSNYSNGVQCKTKINSNEIQLHANYCAGIYVLNALGTNISENYIDQLSSSYSDIISPAIKVANSRSTTVNCNYINDRSGGSASSSYKSSIEAAMSQATEIACNHTENTEDGISIIGDCDNSVIMGNHLYDHGIGLKISNTGICGEQIRTANEWLGSYAVAGAQNNNNVNTVGSRFVYDLVDNNSNSAPQYLPSVIQSTNQWFFLSSGTELACSTFVVCSAAQVACSSTITNNESSVATNRNANRYAALNPVRWLSERNLYNKLLYCPSLLSGTSLSSFFYNFTTSESQRLFSEIDTMQNNLYSAWIADTSLNFYDSVSTAIHYFRDSLMTLVDSSTSIEDVQMFQQSIDYLDQLLLTSTTEIENLYESTQVTRNAMMDTLNNLSSSVYTNDFESNENTLNSLFSTYSRNYPVAIDSVVKDSLIFIANQCPLSGGPGVYKARALLFYYDRTYRYNDESLCLSDSVPLRIGANTSFNNSTLLARPNPTNSITTLEWAMPLTLDSKLEIFDLTGKLISQDIVKAYTSTYIIKTLPSGMYFVIISNKEAVYGPTKIVWSR